MRRSMAAVGLVLVLALAGVVSANLLQNPGFEIGSAGGATPTNWWKYDQCGQENWANHTGTNGMAFWSWQNGVWGGFGQDVVTNLSVGDTITFSIYGLFEANYSSSTKETWLKIEYWTNNASTWIRQDSYSVYDYLAANRETWNQVAFVSTNVTPNVTMIKPIVGYGGGTNQSLSNQSVKWDDADLTVIPEPAIATLLGFAGLLILAARRLVRK